MVHDKNPSKFKGNFSRLLVLFLFKLGRFLLSPFELRNFFNNKFFQSKLSPKKFKYLSYKIGMKWKITAFYTKLCTLSSQSYCQIVLYYALLQTSDLHLLLSNVKELLNPQFFFILLYFYHHPLGPPPSPTLLDLVDVYRTKLQENHNPFWQNR